MMKSRECTSQLVIAFLLIIFVLLLILLILTPPPPPPPPPPPHDVDEGFVEGTNDSGDDTNMQVSTKSLCE